MNVITGAQNNNTIVFEQPVNCDRAPTPPHPLPPLHLLQISPDKDKNRVISVLHLWEKHTEYDTEKGGYKYFGQFNLPGKHWQQSYYKVYRNF